MPPYSHVLDEEVWVKIIAINYYGESPISEPGNDGLVKLIPDAPVNLDNDPVVTDHTKIRFLWDEGSSNGGIPVLDYAIYYDEGSNWLDGEANFVLLETGVPTSYYTTSITLTNNVYY